MFKRKKTPPPAARRRSNFADRPQPPAFSYYAQRSERTVNTARQVGYEEPAPKPRFSAGMYILQRGGLLVLIVAVAILVVSSLSVSTMPRVVPLSGASSAYLLHSTADYERGAASIISSSVWNRNKLTIDTTAISQKLQNKFPELSEVSIALPLLSHRPVIYVAPSTPALTLSTGGGGYIVDQQGKAVLATTQLPPDSTLSLPVVTDQTGLHVAPDKQVLTPANVQFIQTVIAELSARHITIASMVLPPAASELDVHISGQPYFAKFNLEASVQDARQQAGTFIAVKNKLDSEHITPAQYIDVRLDGRAYYK